MGSRVTVFLDDTPHALVVGSRVRDLLAGCDVATRLAIAAGTLLVVDRHGNEVGSDGDLREGQRLYLRPPTMER